MMFDRSDDGAAGAETRTILEELEYVLDQAAIVAVTGQRGTITYAGSRLPLLDGAP